LEAIVEKIQPLAILVGVTGIGPWQKRELRARLDEFVKGQDGMNANRLRSCHQSAKYAILLGFGYWT
jgi:hypothetical protein